MVYAQAESADCQALELASINHWPQAYKCAYKQNNPALLKLVKWLCYQQKSCSTDFKDISDFIIANPDFPDIEILVKRAEEKITSQITDEVLVKWFRKHKPKTATGIKYYIKLSLPHIVDKDKLSKTVKYGWINGSYNSEERALFLQKYGHLLSTQDHIAKIYLLLSKGNTKIDQDILNLIPNNYKELLKARMSLRNDQNNFAKIINNIPKNLRNDTELLFAEAQWYKHKGHHRKLAKLLYDHRQQKSVGADNWFKLRTNTVVELIDTGSYKFAYNIAKDHSYTDLVNYVDGEWLAGRIAYFYLDQPQLAIEHFKNIYKQSKFSVSKSKGAYWSAMAARKLKNMELADEFFVLASRYPDTFYGQLAVMHKSKDPYIILPAEPKIEDDDLIWFKNNQLISAIKLLIQAKKYNLVEKFMKTVIQHNPDPAKILLIVRLGYNINMPRLSVSSGKEAARHGYFLAKHIYPTLKFSPKSNQIEKALMLSIIRQESAFDQYAVSSAEAMGLMQLIHPTAKDVSQELNIRFKKNDLINNPKLNLTFGCHHLTKLIEYYNGSYILAIAAYNAGPGNVNKWIVKYGDPRKLKSAEQVIKWIEKIPFFETRGYVQNVLTNLQVYRSILKNNKTDRIKVNLNQDLLRSNKRLTRS